MKHPDSTGQGITLWLAWYTVFCFEQSLLTFLLSLLFSIIYQFHRPTLQPQARTGLASIWAKLPPRHDPRAIAKPDWMIEVTH